MNIITKKQKAVRAAADWKEAYFHDGKWDSFSLLGTERIYNLLAALSDPSPEQVDQIVGNGSWTRNLCDECGKDCAIVVEVGEPPDTESSTACLCPDCLDLAVHELRLYLIQSNRAG